MILLLLNSAIRLLKKQLALSLVKIAGLAIGMAVFLITALYYLHEWSFDRQHPGSENIYRYVHRVKSQDDLQSFAFTSATTGPALKERYPEVVEFTRVFQIEVSLKVADSDVGFVEKKFAFADENFLRFFNFPIRQGNSGLILVEPYGVILSPSSAEKYFGDLDPIGKTILLNGAIPLVVKGIFQTDFNRSHMRFDFVASFATLEAIKNHPVVSKQIPASINLDHKGFNAFYTYLRLTNPSARQTLEARFPAFIEEFRGEGRSERLKPTLQSLSSIHLHSDLLYEIQSNGSMGILLTFIIVGALILLTAIINYINISTAEFLMRAKNTGLKKIIGIGKGPLLVGHIIETMVVCGLALAAGGIIALFAVPFFNQIMRTEVVFFSRDAILPFVGVFAATVLLSGSMPAIQILRQDALIAFRENQRASLTSRYLRNSLVFLQLTVSFIFLSFALLIVRQTDYLLQLDPGIDASQVMVVNAAGIPPNERIAFRNYLRTDPSVEDVSMCSLPPGETLFTFGLTLPGANGDEDRRITFYHMFVDENLLQTLGVDIREGRFFDAAVPADSLHSFVVNETGAEIIHDSVMTSLIEIPNIYGGKPARKKVVGIIGDFHFASFHATVQPLILEYNPRHGRYLLVRFHPGNAGRVIGNLSMKWKDVAPLLPLNYYFLDNSFADHYAAEQRAKQILLIISGLAVFLASLGIFGTSLFSIQQRTREIGVRKLLGSATRGLFVLLFRPIFLTFFAACAFAIPIVLWAGEEWLARYPFHTDLSFGVLLIAFAIIFAVILITVSSYIVKISRVQPTEVLKSQ